MINNIKIGQIGENAANEYLINNGWNILIKNYKRKGDEIDIIGLSKDRTLVFFEVKTLFINRLSTFDGLSPEDNLSAKKLHKITRACEFFARQHSELIDPDKGWRIDLIAIELGIDQKPKNMRHYENI